MKLKHIMEGVTSAEKKRSWKAKLKTVLNARRRINEPRSSYNHKWVDMITGHDLIRYNRLVWLRNMYKQLQKFHDLKIETLESRIEKLEHENYVLASKLQQRVAGQMGD